MGVRRWLPLSGVVFVVVALVAVVGVGGDTPDSSSSAAEVAKFYADQDVRQALGGLIFVASIPFLVIFAAALGEAYASDTSKVWGQVLVGGSVLAAATIAVLGAIQFALPDGATNGASAATLHALNLISGDGWVAFNAGLGVMMLGAAGTILSSRRGWIGWVALVLGVLLFIPYADFFALILTLLWILVVSIKLFRAEARASAAAAPAPA